MTNAKAVSEAILDVSRRTRSPSAAVLYAHLLGLSRGGQDQALASLSEFARATGLSKASVQRNLPLLEKAGVVTIKRFGPPLVPLITLRGRERPSSS
jgi:DNA-binding transcriptional ArsR family regulator